MQSHRSLRERVDDELHGEVSGLGVGRLSCRRRVWVRSKDAASARLTPYNDLRDYPTALMPPDFAACFTSAIVAGRFRSSSFVKLMLYLASDAYLLAGPIQAEHCGCLGY